MDDDTFRDVMTNWVLYNRTPDMTIGWPRKSPVFSEAGGSWDGYGWDDDRGQMPQSEAYAVVDKTEAQKVQVVVDDLPPRERDSVYNTWLCTKRPLGEPLDTVYARARTMLFVGLRKRGVK